MMYALNTAYFYEEEMSVRLYGCDIMIVPYIY